jgi:hypothetical protein
MLRQSRLSVLLCDYCRCSRPWDYSRFVSVPWYSMRSSGYERGNPLTAPIGLAICSTFRRLCTV